MRHPGLLKRSATVLALIDMQEGFRPLMADFDELSERLALLVEACRLLGVPIVVTEQCPKGLGPTVEAIGRHLPSEQYPKGLGPTVEAIARHLPAGERPIEKLSFSACGVGEFDLRLREAHAEQILLCGIEAHICVAQTGLQLLHEGYQVHLLRDGVGSRLPRNQEVAARRLESAGAIVSSIEMALFELCPAGTAEFKQMQQIVKRLR